eukprot:364180-Chlamydomonas_euryale.AAC.16
MVAGIKVHAYTDMHAPQHATCLPMGPEQQADMRQNTDGNEGPAGQRWAAPRLLKQRTDMGACELAIDTCITDRPAPQSAGRQAGSEAHGMPDDRQKRMIATVSGTTLTGMCRSVPAAASVCAAIIVEDELARTLRLPLLKTS